MKTANTGMATRTASRAVTVGGWVGKPWCGAAVVFLFLAVTGATAQQPGDTVRVSGAVVGVVVEADRAGLLLTSGYAPYAGMRSLEVWGGTMGQAGRGFKYGFTAGALLGVAGGLAFCLAGGCNPGFIKTILAASGWAGLLVGAAGAVIGSAVKGDIWETVPIPGGISLRLAVGGR